MKKAVEKPTVSRHLKERKLLHRTRSSRNSLGAITILVPIDFSEYSRRALDYAAGLARSTGGELILLHVVQSFPVDRFIDQKTLQADNTARLQGGLNELEELEEALTSATGIPSRHTLRVGKPCVKILEVAGETEADLIVMGSHGYTGLQRVWLGSTSERVVREAPCQVLVVRD